MKPAVDLPVFLNYLHSVLSWVSTLECVAVKYTHKVLIYLATNCIILGRSDLIYSYIRLARQLPNDGPGWRLEGCCLVGSL